MVPGEKIIDALGDVEDTKGNNGDHGHLTVTNLRIIWISSKNKKINLSIDFGCLVNLTIRLVESRLRGTTRALYILCKQGATNYQFVFTNVLQSTPRLFTTVITQQYCKSIAIE